MKIFVIPATYNECGTIERFITTLEEEVFPEIKNHEMYILVADDTSPDGTGDIVRRLMGKYSNLGLNTGHKKGLGAAYIRAMSEAIEKHGADVVVSIDADFQFNPHDLPKFLRKIDEGYDVVIQSRYSSGGSIPSNWPLQRKLFSIVANLFVRTVFMRFNIHDWTGGFRAIKKEVFLKERAQMHEYNGYIFQIAFLHKAIRDGFRIAEVPVHFSDRKVGSSKIAPLSYIITVVSFVLSARLRELSRFLKFLVVGGTGFIVQLILQEGSYFSGFASAIALGFSLLFHTTDNTALVNGIAAAIGAESAIISNFLFNNYWTFRDRKHQDLFKTFQSGIKFNLAAFASVIVEFLAIWLAVLSFGPAMKVFRYSLPTRDIILIPTIILVVIPMNYMIYNALIWKKPVVKVKAV